MYKIKFSKDYEEDVMSSLNYIKHELKNPTAAKKLRDEIKKTNKRLKKNPFSYSAVPDEYLAAKSYRFAIVKNYIIFYIVQEKQIDVIRFLYGYRDWMNILKK